MIYWDINKNNLMFWCQFYNMYVFSKDEKERPDDFTINSDILLDEWVDQYEFKKKMKVKNSASESQQVFRFD